MEPNRRRGQRPYTMKPAKHRLTLLVFLILFASFVLLVSVVISSIISFLLLQIRVLPPLLHNGFPMMLICIILFSLIIGVLLSTVMGRRSLRPFRELIDATKEVSTGNFDVHVKPAGPDELKRLISSFNDMAKGLSSIETLRQDFVSNISHEFKTPVVSIKGFAKLLKKDTLTEEQRNEYLDIIISESDRLTQLSSNVLLLSNLESTDHLIETSAFDLDEQMRRVILLLEPQLQKKQLELDLNLAPVRVTAHEEMLQHVWINLLGNAIKFSKEQDTIRVNLFSDSELVTVQISDQGIGMDEETCTHIFDKFYQGDRSHSGEGNGLGLSLVKRILELSDGEISVESTPGEGTTFTLTFPLT